jgi:hypothetical protein
MRHKLLCASCMIAVAVLGAAPAYANKGGPSNMCGFTGPPPSGPSTNPATSGPGNSITSPGSTHNEGGTVSTAGGTGGVSYNRAGAPSQYDNSCANVTANNNGTPIVFSTSPSTLPTRVPNNSLATRTMEGVTSHTPKG